MFYTATNETYNSQTETQVIKKAPLSPPPNGNRWARKKEAPDFAVRQQRSTEIFESSQIEYALDNIVVIPAESHPSNWKVFSSKLPDRPIRVWDLTPGSFISKNLEPDHSKEKEFGNVIVRNSGVSWGAFPAPSIGFLVYTSRDIDSWLREDQKNVAVISTAEQSSRVILLLAAYKNVS